MPPSDDLDAVAEYRGGVDYVLHGLNLLERHYRCGESEGVENSCLYRNWLSAVVSQDADTGKLRLR